MREQDILQLTSMPAVSPSYPAGPYRFTNREYMVISYESDPQLIRAQLPEPLEPLDAPLVHCQWIHMPDGSGFGSYTGASVVLPCRFDGAEVNFNAQMYLDDGAPVVAGREIWGYPMKYAQPKLEVAADTLTGTLAYAGELVALGTMNYKHERAAGDAAAARTMLSKTLVNLKLIPGVDGRPEICRLVGYHMTEITVKGSWHGAARLHLVPHANAPLADLPVRRIVGAHHLVCDLTLPYGRVLHDYVPRPETRRGHRSAEGRAAE